MYGACQNIYDDERSEVHFSLSLEQLSKIKKGCDAIKHHIANRIYIYVKNKVLLAETLNTFSCLCFNESVFGKC